MVRGFGSRSHMADRLVGRERDLRRIEPLLGRLAEGRGGLLLVTGEPGIGKTRFAEEALLKVRATARVPRGPLRGSMPVRRPCGCGGRSSRQLDLDTTALNAAAPESADDADAARFAQFAAVAAALREPRTAVPS